MENTNKRVRINMIRTETFSTVIELDNKFDIDKIDYEKISNKLSENITYNSNMSGVESVFPYRTDSDDKLEFEEVNEQPNHYISENGSIGNVVPENTKSVLIFESQDGRSKIDKDYGELLSGVSQNITLFLSGSKEEMKKLWEEGKIDELSGFNIIPDIEYVKTRRSYDRYFSKYKFPELHNPRYFNLIYQKRSSKVVDICLWAVETYKSGGFLSYKCPDHLSDDKKVTK